MKKNKGKIRGHRHAGVRSIDYFAYASRLCAWNATFKVVFALTMLVFCLAADHLAVSLFTIISMAWLLVCLGKLPVRSYFRLLSIPLGFLILSSLAIALHFSSTPQGEYYLSLHFFYVHTSRADLLFILSLICKSLGAVSAMYLMTLTTPASEIVGVLRLVHTPKIIIELMYLTYRFIFILLDEHGRMHAAAASRLGHRGFRESVRSFGGIAGNLLVLSMRRASTYYHAMESRCYTGEIRFLEQEKPICKRQVMIACIICSAAFALWLLAGRGR